MPRFERCSARWDCRRIRVTEADWKRLGDRTLLRMMQQLFLIREFEERLLRLKDEDLVHGPVHSSIGQEAVAVGTAAVLRPDDLISSTHRAHHHFLAKLLSAAAGPEDPADEFTEEESRIVRRTLAEILGLAEGWCRGRGGSMHLADPGAGVLGTNAIVSGGVPLTVGAGWAEARMGTGRISLAFFGEGALNQGSFHEAMNLAVLWNVPTVFLLENNLYAVGTRVDRSVCVEPVVQRAAGYGMAARVVDGMDPVAVAAAVGEAAHRARAGREPTFLEVRTYRFRHQAQSLRGSAYGYRTRDEEREWEARDPLKTFPEALERRGIADGRLLKRMRSAARKTVRAAVGAFVESTERGRRILPSAWPDPGDVTVGLRSDGREWEGVEFAERESFREWETKTYLDVISETIGRRMEEDDRVVVLGEEVANMKGGAFQATRGLPARFPDRVLNTPISEAGFCGLALGAALRGLRPVVEIMYPDFTLVAADQIFNQIGKARHMYGGDRDIPIVVRTRIGIGNGYGAQHSMDPAPLYSLFPGWRIVTPATAFDYIGLFNSALQCADPVLVIEHQRLYPLKDEVPRGERDYRIRLGAARTVRPGTDLTVVTYGSMLHDVLAAAEILESEGIGCEVIDLRSVDALSIDLETIARSVTRTNRVLLVEQAPWVGGIGMHLADRIQRDLFDELDAPVNRVAAIDVPPPVSRILETYVHPSVDDVVEAARRTIEGRVWIKPGANAQARGVRE